MATDSHGELCPRSVRYLHPLHSSDQVQGQRADLRRVTVPVLPRHTGNHHVGVPDRLNLVHVIHLDLGVET